MTACPPRAVPPVRFETDRHFFARMRKKTGLKFAPSDRLESRKEREYPD